MRSRLGGVLAIAAVVAWAGSACNTAGVSAVYMAIDTGGAQHRQIFYTDSNAIYCIAKFSAARQDATLDFTFHQMAIFPWCSALKNGNTEDKVDIHPIFAVGEETPGTGVETVVAEQLLASGTPVNIPCNGYCTQNLPSGSICGSTPPSFDQSGPCRPLYTSGGADTCGIGLTCCEQDVASSSTQTGMPLALIPFPAGLYSCDVTLDGVEAGSTEFEVDYPPGNCPVPPPTDGIPCYNWVPKGASCAGNSSDQKTCVCGESGVWSCGQ
jgi:hypothetical protein